MQDLDDLALLREYAANNTEASFAGSVARRSGFVYSAALRQVRDPHLAEEITQAVFIILAQKAGKISDKTILAGWLFKTTRYVAIAQTREIVKRSLRTTTIEKEFQMQTELQSAATDPLWEQMSPLLDEALAALGETDRQTVLLRFFENKSLTEVGNFLGIGEDTARKRVSRALEKLHRHFSKRGVSSTTAIIAGAMSTNSVQAAPMALAKSVTAVALAKGAAASGSTLTLIKGALKIMAWTKAKTAIVVGVIAILAAGTTTVIVKKVNHAHLIEAQAFYDSAMKYYMAREYEAELTDLNKAIELNPKFADALFSRASLYYGDLPMKERDYVKSAADYSQFLSLKPTDYSGRFNRALCYESLNQYDKAIADYTTVIEGNTDYSHLIDGKDKSLAMAYHYRGRAYQWYKKDYLKAIADYDEALRLDPQIEMVHQHRGQCYEALKQFDKAKEDFAIEEARQPK